MKYHYNTVHSSVVIACDKCDYKANHQLQLKSHVKNMHSKLNRLKICEICDKNVVNIRSHLSVVHKEELKKCTVCDNEIYNLSNHMNQVHGETQFQCDLCEYSATTIKCVSEHKKRHHEKTRSEYPCNDCDKKFSSKQALKYHFNGTHNKYYTELVCDICEFKTKQPQNLRAHKNKIHPNFDRFEKCDICGKSYKDLALHIKYLHQEKGKKKCELCDKTLSSINYKAHLARIHKIQTNGYTWQNCDVCNKQIFGKLSMKAHRQNHTKAKKKFECEYDQCAYVGGSVYRLKKHVDAIHLQLRPFQCEVCDASFKRKAHLEGHANAYHSEIRQNRYECDKCEFKTNHQNNFNNHVNAVHLGVRAYKCDTCDQTFTQNSHLNTHRKSVHLKQKPFQCNFCDQRFSSRQQFDLHEKAVHKEFGGDPEFKCDKCDFKTHYRDSLKKHKASKKCKHFDL